MSGGALRRASSLLLGRLGGSAKSGTSLQQQRGTHDLSVHPNKHVENWLSKREDIDAEFVWNRQTIWHVILGVLVIPTLIYNGHVWQAHKDDEYGDRPKRCVCAGSCGGWYLNVDSMPYNTAGQPAITNSMPLLGSSRSTAGSAGAGASKACQFTTCGCKSCCHHCHLTSVSTQQQSRQCQHGVRPVLVLLLCCCCAATDVAVTWPVAVLFLRCCRNFLWGHAEAGEAKQ